MGVQPGWDELDDHGHERQSDHLHGDGIDQRRLVHHSSAGRQPGREWTGHVGQRVSAGQYAYPDAYPDADTNAYPDAYPDADTNAYPDAYPDADTNAYPDADPGSTHPNTLPMPGFHGRREGAILRWPMGTAGNYG